MHTLDDFQFGLQPFGFFNSDDAFLTDLVHRAGDDAADGLVIVGGNCADLSNFFLILGGLAHFAELFDNNLHGLVDAAFHIHRIGARRYGFHALAVNGLRQKRGGGCAVARDIAGLAGNFFNHLRAHVFKFIFQFDFLGHGHTDFCHGR